MNSGNSKRECPGSEMLSLWLDGELDQEERVQVEAHLRSCPDCRKWVDADKRIDEAFTRYLDQSLHRDLPFRILAGVRRELEREPIGTVSPFPHRTHLGPSFFRIAASIVVGIGAVLLSIRFFSENHSSGSSSGLPRVSAPIPSMESSDAFDHAVTNRDIRFLGNRRESAQLGHDHGAVALTEMTAVSSDGKLRDAITSAQGLDRVPQSIAANVHHVWAVQDLDSVQRDIAVFAEKNQIAEKKRVLAENKKGNGVKLNLRLTKGQLVDLVRECSESGMELLSPQPPQPETSLFTGDADTVVQYNADFVLAHRP
jgi:hypothetical protein